MVNDKPLRYKLRDFIGNIIFCDADDLDLQDSRRKSEYYDYAITCLKNEFACSTENDYGLCSSFVRLSDLDSDINFRNTSRFECNVLCESIMFDYKDEEGTMKHAKLTINNTNFVAGRRTILRDLLNHVIEFVVKNRKDFNYATLPLSEVDIVDDLGLAVERKRGINLSCRAIPFTFHGETHYILPHTGTPKSSLKSVVQFLEVLGVDKSSVVLKFNI